MFNKFNKFYAACSNGVVIAACLMFGMSTSVHATDTINGNACIAANLNQAFELQWNHAWVVNPASNSSSRFVTCSMTAGQKWLGAAGSFKLSSADSGGISTIWLAGASPASTVSCIFREIGEDNTTPAAIDSKSVTIVAPASIPGTRSATFVSGDGLNFGSQALALSNQLRSFTVTCNLAPGTGINTIWMNSTPPPSPPP